MFGSLGMPEILFILVIALIVFGPRKLPQIGKTLGESLSQFRKASEDFKRSWEAEVSVQEKPLAATSAATFTSPQPSEEKSVSEPREEPAAEPKIERPDKPETTPVSESPLSTASTSSTL